ncbi:MAG: hypothetical protein HY566_02775 [Candidatus Kerfeldbacteria bacterium]|nr:hypothetical protein [Candidatus Kerfeldbacteria bacterium]
MLPLLVGGAPTAGKSAVASALGRNLGLTVGSLDDLRDEFRDAAHVRRHRYPWIFSSVGMSAEEFWKARTPADVMRVEIEQGREFWPTIKQFIESGRYGIVEGVSIIPELVWRDFGDTIKAVFLIDPDRERVHKTVFERGVWDEANAYADWIKPLEVEWIMLHNEWFRQQAKLYPYPLLEVGEDRDALVRQVENIVEHERV